MLWFCDVYSTYCRKTTLINFTTHQLSVSEFLPGSGGPNGSSWRRRLAIRLWARLWAALLLPFLPPLLLLALVFSVLLVLFVWRLIPFLGIDLVSFRCLILACSNTRNPNYYEICVNLFVYCMVLQEAMSGSCVCVSPPVVKLGNNWTEKHQKCICVLPVGHRSTPTPPQPKLLVVIWIFFW